MTSNSTSYAGCWLSNSFAFYLTLHAGKYTPHQNARQRTKRQDTLASLHVALQMITPMRWSGTGSQPRVAGAGAARAPACGKACCRAPRCTPATLMQPAAATAGSTPSICPTAPLSPAARWRRCTCTAKMMVSGQRVAGRQQCCCRLMTAPACQNSTMPQDEYAPHALECSLGICKFLHGGLCCARCSCGSMPAIVGAACRLPQVQLKQPHLCLASAPKQLPAV